MVMPMLKQKQSASTGRNQKSLTGVLAMSIIFSVCLSAAKCDTGPSDTDKAASAEEPKAPPFSKAAADALFYEKLPKSRGKDLEGRVNDYLNVQFKAPMPWDFFQSMGKESVPIFIAVIKDPNRADEWRNAVNALGRIGDATATMPLIELLENTEGNLPAGVSDALFTIPDSLGLIAASGDGEALRYLTSHLPPDSWRKLKWRELEIVPGQDAFLHMSDRLEAAVIRGLGVSGLPSAKNALLSEIARIENGNFEDGFTKTRLERLQSEVEFNDEIRRVGLRNYYSPRGKVK